MPRVKLAFDIFYGIVVSNPLQMKKNKIEEDGQEKEDIKKSRQKEKKAGVRKGADEVFQEYQKIFEIVKSLGGKFYSVIKREDFIKRNNYEHNANFLFTQEEKQDVFEMPGTPYTILIWINRDIQLFKKKVLRLFIISKRSKVVCKAHIDYPENQKKMNILITNLAKTLGEVIEKVQALSECSLCGSNNQKYFMFIKKKKQEIFLVCSHTIAHDGGREMRIPFKKASRISLKKYLFLLKILLPIKKAIHNDV